MGGFMRATAVAVFALTIITGLSAAKANPPGGATSGTWQALTNAAPVNVDSPLLLTDGTVMVHETCPLSGGPSGTRWFRLTPDSSGSYVDGTWSELAPTPGYAPLFYASAVLPD